MFSRKEKRVIATVIEKLLLSLSHPEMPDEKPDFDIHINGKEGWSWADIKPNWKFDDGLDEVGVNWFNENARDILK